MEVGVRDINKRVKADLAPHLHHFSSSSFGWLLLDILSVACVRAWSRKLLALQQEREEGSLE